MNRCILYTCMHTFTYIYTYINAIILYIYKHVQLKKNALLKPWPN